MTIRDFLSEKRRAANPWEGYSFYQVYTDGAGKPFQDGNKRYVIFDGEALVGEFLTQREADKAYLDGVRAVDGIRKKDYKGLGGYHA